MARAGRKIALLLLAVGSVAAAAGCGTDSPATFSEWSAPVNLGASVNSAVQDAGAAISQDGLTLYLGSTRPGGVGGFDIWVSTRRTVANPWGTPTNLGLTVNSGFADNVPALSRDEHWLFFNSDRPGGSGDLDIWVSWRTHVDDDFGWQQPVNLGPAINTPLGEVGPSFMESRSGIGPLLFFGSGEDIYVSSQRADGSFGEAARVAEVSSPAIDGRPHVRFDGLEMILQSDRTGTLGLLDLWTSTRDSVPGPWSVPVNLGPTINAPFRDLQAYLTPNGETLYFTSDRPGGLGGTDLYTSTRTRR